MGPPSPRGSQPWLRFSPYHTPPPSRGPLTSGPPGPPGPRPPRGSGPSEGSGSGPELVDWTPSELLVTESDRV
ncbi:unnamed protein product [Arctogadus glacialis]